MTTEGICGLQRLLDQRQFLDGFLADGLWRVLKRYETQGRTAFDPAVEVPRTWQYLGDAVDALIASSPWNSDDPVMVTGREVAPHLLIEAWCTRSRVWAACAASAAALTGVEAFTIYEECGMGAGPTKRDFGGNGKRSSVLVQVQSLCMGLAFEVVEYAADDDLEPGPS